MITGYSGGGGFGNSASGRGGSDGSDGYDGTGDNFNTAPGGGSGVQISEIPLNNFALRYVKNVSVMNSLGSIIGRPVIG